MEIKVESAKMYKEKLCILSTYLNSSYDEVRTCLHSAIGNYLDDYGHTVSKEVNEDLERAYRMLEPDNK